MAAKKKSLTSTQKNAKKPGLGRKKVDKSDQENKPKELSKSQIKKKEFQRKKYNKDNKKKTAASDDEDSEFEIVPSAVQSRSGDYASESEDDSDLELDMFGKFKEKKPAAVAVAAAKQTAKPKPIIVNQDDDDDGTDAKFIATENLAANRKNKKSGGFQSMGKWIDKYIYIYIE
jgi:ATP-dependent RNA helicase DDX54/DBP10